MPVLVVGLSLPLASFEVKLPEIFRDIHDTYENIDARLKAEQFKVRNGLSQHMILSCQNVEGPSTVKALSMSSWRLFS